MGGAYLHEGDEQEEGVGGPTNLLVQEPRQEREHPILGGTAEKQDRRSIKSTLNSLHLDKPTMCISKIKNSRINLALMIVWPDNTNSVR